MGENAFLPCKPGLQLQPVVDNQGYELKIRLIDNKLLYNIINIFHIRHKVLYYLKETTYWHGYHLKINAGIFAVEMVVHNKPAWVLNRMQSLDIAVVEPNPMVHRLWKWRLSSRSHRRSDITRSLLHCTALCILESYIGNIVVWKHHLHLERKNVYWRHTFDFGNIRIRLET